MTNVFDYITWRGDLTFSQSAINEVDNLIFCRLSYLPFEGILSPSFFSRTTLTQAIEQFLIDWSEKEEQLLKTGVIQKEDIQLLKTLIESNRFRSLSLSGYVNQINYEEQKQFSCITFHLDNNCHFLAFRGTDSTLVGWKEDFNLGFLPVIPSHLDALHYLEQAADTLQGQLYLGGHSKGGNLAIYASVFCPDQIRARIAGVYSNDSPGFNANTMIGGHWDEMKDRILSFIPQTSVIGMMLEHEEDYIVVHSYQHGLFQHDMYTWEVVGTSFVHLETVNAGSRFLNRTLMDWIMQLSIEEREKFINSLYDIISATNAKTLQDLAEGGLKNAGTLVSAYKQTDKSTRQLLTQILAALLQAGRKNLGLLKPRPVIRDPDID